MTTRLCIVLLAVTMVLKSSFSMSVRRRCSFIQPQESAAQTEVGTEETEGEREKEMAPLPQAAMGENPLPEPLPVDQSSSRIVVEELPMATADLCTLKVS